MDKAEIENTPEGQFLHLPRKYFLDTEKILIQEHELGVLLIDPEKKWKRLEKMMGSMKEDFFPDGRDQGEWVERDPID